MITTNSAFKNIKLYILQRDMIDMEELMEIFESLQLSNKDDSFEIPEYVPPQVFG